MHIIKITRSRRACAQSFRHRVRVEKSARVLTAQDHLWSSVSTCRRPEVEDRSTVTLLKVNLPLHVQLYF